MTCYLVGLMNDKRIITYDALRHMIITGVWWHSNHKKSWVAFDSRLGISMEKLGKSHLFLGISLAKVAVRVGMMCG